MTSREATNKLTLWFFHGWQGALPVVTVICQRERDDNGTMDSLKFWREELFPRDAQPQLSLNPQQIIFTSYRQLLHAPTTNTNHSFPKESSNRAGCRPLNQSYVYSVNARPSSIPLATQPTVDSANCYSHRSSSMARDISLVVWLAQWPSSSSTARR